MTGDAPAPPDQPDGRHGGVSVLVNIDVPDLDRAERFYCAAFGLTVGRRLSGGAVELMGAQAPIWLLEQPAGSRATTAAEAGAEPGTGQERHYARHWTPLHLDFVVADIDAALARAEAAGAVAEGPIQTHRWGRIVVLADLFGHGFCLIESRGRGYDEIAEPVP
jgi:predicted enzyme related to lactoylglutathione lyase